MPQDDPTASSPANEQTPPATSRSRRTHRAGARRAGSGILEFLLTLLIALLVAALIKTFLLQAFRIPSPSMEETLTSGDRIAVSKLDPEPFDTQRGDIVVFEDPAEWLGPVDDTPPTFGERVESVFVFLGVWPDSASNHLVKRVVGVGGDTVVCEDPGAQVEVNGTTIDEFYLADEVPPCVAAFDIDIPADSFFVLGDNRTNSADSAYHFAEDVVAGGDGSAGFVPAEDVEGRALAVIWPLDRLGGLLDGRDAFADVPSA